ncbi:MAG: AbrB/MazE/SpoVT family DNA-binding domain-containing protein [Methanobacterium sp.]|nr:MAG: AbrB/MazE/SpoVT family DNA-binding domain-containing protein [Methanobacterium sp.]
MEQIMKFVDNEGRVVLPKKWRDKHLKGQAVLMKIQDGKITIEEYKLPDLTQLINSVDADIESDLDDWKGVKRDLLAIR